MAMQDDNVNVRCNAAEALGETRDLLAFDAVENLLEMKILM
jgi:HEAT repeat protein